MNRPISPHLSIYKVQITSALSILHRISGIIALGGTLLFIWWFIGLIFSDLNQFYLSVWNYIIVKILAWGLSLNVFYHLCNGIRHIFWDMGLGFAIQTIHKTGLLTISMSVFLTTIFWLFLYIN